MWAAQAIVGGFVIAFSELFITFAYKKVAAYLLGEGALGDGLLQAAIDRLQICGFLRDPSDCIAGQANWNLQREINMIFLFGKFYQPSKAPPKSPNNLILAGIMACLLAMVGFSQSWNLAFSLLNMCLISAIMALGVNIQWGYAGLFNAGVMGFAALGGLAAVLIAVDPVTAAWAAGGRGLLFGFSIGVLTTYIAILAWKRLQNSGLKRYWVTI